MRKGYKALLAEAEAQVTAVDADAARGLLGRDDVVFVDLREAKEREREGSIPGAFPCPRGMLEFWIDPESPYARPVFAAPKRFVFYCASGWRSALATRTAQEMGLENVAHLGGGFTAWKQAGGEVATVPPKGR
ncbi:rhodanese-like domain-containing protein [Roseomonas sp. NAR14]|uniref:Rhodanese-like domain-containing protein n=1 Tax=Roseomonas acroporae TaxID=2937791 RepID=A0A9X2BVI7_9PROT|nr:rhodanese-like domain-containing protein [Roseomonas acroporae]MCK8784049.1 rhodanese-like domain-containing protein [Roseomonas acroporae]